MKFQKFLILEQRDVKKISKIFKSYYRSLSLNRADAHDRTDPLFWKIYFLTRKNHGILIIWILRL